MQSDKKLKQPIPATHSAIANEAGICIQGYEGSFHQVAARYFFGKQIGVIPCDTFRELVKKSQDKKQSAGGIMAIENSIAGSILQNYSLIRDYHLRIIGEIYIHIQMNLMVLPGVKFICRSVKTY